MKLLSSIFFLALLLTSCGQKSITQDTPKGTNIFENPLALSLDESITFDGVTLRFLEVVEDSRCPTGLSCVWAGRAIVKVEVTSKGKKEEKTLIFGEVMPGEEKNTTLYTSPDFTINGITLNPYPDADNASEETEYVLLVRKE